VPRSTLIDEVRPILADPHLARQICSANRLVLVEAAAVTTQRRSRPLGESDVRSEVRFEVIAGEFPVVAVGTRLGLVPSRAAYAALCPG
jgi:hypothetical protein